MKSMTGYGYSEYQDEQIHISFEIKSYNNRYLDIIINLPPFLNSLEPELRKLITADAARGRVEVYIRVRELEEDLTVHLDRGAVKAYSETLRELASAAGIEADLRPADFLQLEGILKTEKKRDIDIYRLRVNELYAECSRQWDASRKAEGRTAEEDIRSHIGQIADALVLFEQKAGEMESNIVSGIRTKFSEVLGDQADEQRVLAETAVLLVKYSINEEIVRLRAHIDAFLKEAGSGSAVGKKLDFLCQEINREINTIGSKSFMVEINQKVVDVKDKLENIREQLRNVE